jgi:Domain of unknown function (DUF4412)
MKPTHIWTLSALAFSEAMLLILASSAEAQDFTIRMKTDDGAVATTYYVSPNAIRQTMTGIKDVIDRFDRGTIIYLDHKSKTYKEISAAEARAAIAKAMTNLDPQKQEMLQRMGMTEVAKVGPGETIAGYPTEKYSVKSAMARGEMWITQSLQFPAPYYKDFNLFAGQGGPFGEAEKTAEIRGVILKRMMTMGMGGRGTSGVVTVTASVDKGNIPASTFEPPNGYSKVSK